MQFVCLINNAINRETIEHAHIHRHFNMKKLFFWFWSFFIRHFYFVYVSIENRVITISLVVSIQFGILNGSFSRWLKIKDKKSIFFHFE